MRSSRTGIARWGPPLVLVGLVVLAWEAYVRIAGLDPITLPPPPVPSRTDALIVLLVSCTVPVGVVVILIVPNALQLDDICRTCTWLALAPSCLLTVWRSRWSHAAG